MHILALLLLPPLLIFGLYHLTIWFSLLGMRRRVFWRRVGLTSAIAHLLFAAGVFIQVWVDYDASRAMFGGDPGFTAFLVNSANVWQILMVFDTLAGVSLLGLLAISEHLGFGSGLAVPATVAVVLSLGTFQWYWVGAAVGTALERLWSGLKTQDDDGPDWL